MIGTNMWAAVQYHPRYNDRDSVCGYYRHELERFDSPEEAEFFIGEIFEDCNFDTDDTVLRGVSWPCRSGTGM